MVQIVKRWNIRSWSQRNISLIPDVVGVYVLYNLKKQPLYVDMSSNLKTKLLNHYNYDDILDVAFFKCYHTDRRGGIILKDKLYHDLYPKYLS
ncbi:hypothetical protein KAW18_02265 [candidate division WOR-3 bacterium]|nr:hypothetical protein [candidate division WOR-3 bacterium]